MPENSQSMNSSAGSLTLLILGLIVGISAFLYRQLGSGSRNFSQYNLARRSKKDPEYAESLSNNLDLTYAFFSKEKSIKFDEIILFCGKMAFDLFQVTDIVLSNDSSESQFGLLFVDCHFNTMGVDFGGQIGAVDETHYYVFAIKDMGETYTICSDVYSAIEEKHNKTLIAETIRKYILTFS